MSIPTGEVLTFKIGEHLYQTPPVPEKKDILFSDLPVHQQYWRRQKDFPSIFYKWHREGDGVETDAEMTRYDEGGNLISLSKEDTIILFGDPKNKSHKYPNGEPEGLQLREFRRRKEGVWFMNDGEPTYITGDHYAALQWFPMLGCTNEAEDGSDYGQYMQFQRDVSYFWDICEKTNIAVGGLLVKPKKTGISQLMALRILNRATLVRQKNLRMMSITENICREINFRFVSYAMVQVPPIILPSRAKQNESEVVFGPPNASRSPLKKRRDMDVDYLNNWVTTVPTTRAGFDGVTNFLAWIDEFPKIKDSTYPLELFTATIAAVKEGINVKGTVYGTSYVPEKSDRSFDEARKLYKESKLSTRGRDANGEPVGKTLSELLCHTLTVDEGIFGCCDKYGKPNKLAIHEFLATETAKFQNDPVRIQAFRRQYPHNETDPWQEANTGDSLFDSLRIGNKIMDLEELYAVGDLPYMDFNLEYQQEPVKKKLGTQYDFPGSILVVPVTDEAKRNGAQHGKFKWYRPEWTPEWFMEKYVNKRAVHLRTGLLMPNQESPFFISIDPTNYRSKGMTAQGSLNAIQAFIMPYTELDTYIKDRVTENRLFIEYLYRQDKPSDTLHDMIKLMLWLGCMVQIEGNVPVWPESLIEMGLGHYLLMINDETGVLEPWDPKRKQRFFSSQKETIPWYVNDTMEHLGEPTMPHHIDNIKYLDSLNVLEQLNKFKIEDTKKFDAAVAYMEGIMGIKAWQGYRRSEMEKKLRRGDGTLSMAARSLAR
jgi:hypothetical protein